MRNKKMILAFAIVALIGFSMAACEDSTEDGSSKDYDYTENNGKITITKYKGTGGNVTIPSNINVIKNIVRLPIA